MNHSCVRGGIALLLLLVSQVCLSQSAVAGESEIDAFVRHCWDDIALADSVVRHSRDFERCFIQFLYVSCETDDSVFADGLATLLPALSGDSISLTTVARYAEDYLFNPGSPIYNEPKYLVFLTSLLSLPSLPEGLHERCTTHQRLALMNAPTTVATDFTYTTTTGEQHTLLTTIAPQLLLIFYDPACPHCDDILRTIEHSRLINSHLDDHSLIALAVYTEGDRALWQSTCHTMPSQWTVAIDESDIVTNSLYNIPAMPTLYLLDRQKRVLLKDPTVAQVEEFLSK